MEDLAKRLLTLANAYATRHGGKILRELGHGGSAAVFELASEQSRTALKVYDPTFFSVSNGPAELRRVELQRGLLSHGCSELIEILDVETADGTCFVSMEFIPWPTLKAALPSVPDDCVVRLMSQLVRAVRFLDSKGIVHRDIKPENILVSPDCQLLKLIDLGVAREMHEHEDAIDATDHSGRRPFIATAQYSSPEYLFRLQAPSQSLWRALTLYQLGGVLHDLVMKRPLFQASVLTGNKFNVAAAVLRQVPEFQGVGADLLPLATLAAHCLSKSPELRLKLVSLESFESQAATAAETLRARMERAALAKRATSDLAQLSRHHDAERKNALEAVSQSVKTQLLELLAKRFPLKSVPQGPSGFKLAVTLDERNVITFFVDARWEDAGNPLVGEVSLRAALNLKQSEGELEAVAIGEIDAAAAGLTALCASLVEAVCKVIVRSQDLVDVSSSEAAPSLDAVDALGSGT